MMLKKLLILLVLVVLSASFVYWRFPNSFKATVAPFPKVIPFEQFIENGNQETLTIPSKKLLVNNYHIFQTFNNCGPASLSMALSYFGINVTQKTLGDELRPYQNPQGNNDDKSTTLEELAQKAEEYNFIAYHRPNGSANLIKLFIANGMPVITETWLKEDEDIGHYRVMKGYDDAVSEFTQDDSYQGKNLKYSYDEFNRLWEKFNYEYLVFVPKDKENLAKKILGDDIAPKVAWKKAAQLSEKQLEKDPNDIYARFNLSVASYYIGDYQRTVDEFEKVQDKLPFRTLWYQIEPIQAYYKLGQYDKVFSITDRILNTGNKAFSELYIIRGEIYLKQGKRDLAKQEFEKAVFYNTSLKAARDALEKVQ